MLYLSEGDSRLWRRLADAYITDGTPLPATVPGIHAHQLPAFRCYVGGRLATAGEHARAKAWFRAGALEEDQNSLLNGFIVGLMERHGNRLIQPAVPFEDPRPFVHFASLPPLRRSRDESLRLTVKSLPVFRGPVRIMDLGCGNGALVSRLATQLCAAGKAPAVDEFLLVDSSAAMTELARETVAADHPGTLVRTRNQSIQQAAATLDSHYDIALMSLAYHHMPGEEKTKHMRRLAAYADHFVLFELEANHETPEVDDPELTYSVYQSYGPIIDHVFAHDAPVSVANACVDCFLMCEVVSLLTEPRGRRSEYHMLRSQWHDLFRSCLGPEFRCLAEATTLAESECELYMLHYGRTRTEAGP